MQVEHGLVTLITAGVEGNEAGEEIHRHQVEVQCKLRHLAELDRAFEHQHQTVLVGLAHPRQAVEADVARAVEIDQHAAFPGTFEDAFANPFGQVVTVLDVDRRSLRGGLFKDPAIGGHCAGGRECRDEVEDLFAAPFAQPQAFENRFDVVPSQRPVIEYVIDVGGVVHQGAELQIEARIVVVSQSQRRTRDVGRVNPNPAPIQMLKTVLAQRLGEAFVSRLVIAIANQASDFAGTASQ
ncbi:hypothetical protein D3C76_771350 [compost metagenome]